MWTAAKDQDIAAQFDEHHLATKDRWLRAVDGSGDRAGECLSVLQRVGLSVKDLSVLDLGGGVLLCRQLASARRYTVVDLSGESLATVLAHNPRAEAVRMDVASYLDLVRRYGEERWDVTLCIGTGEYMPAWFLPYLFREAPSDWLLLYVCVAESYLQYPGRITIPERHDLNGWAAAEGWETEVDLPFPSHVFRLYRRRAKA